MDIIANPVGAMAVGVMAAGIGKTWTMTGAQNVIKLEFFLLCVDKAPQLWCFGS